MLFTRGETVRFTPRSREATPMDAIVASLPFGVREVPALGEFYFIVAPAFRGVVSADRLSRTSASLARMIDRFARRSEFDEGS
jgi:hypothetical protein